MNILVIIPARGSSKRLKNKNLALVGNKSLLKRTIQFAKKIVTNENIILTTDSDKIIKKFEKTGILIPWKRPKYLSTDTAKSIDVVKHALKWYEKNIKKVDFILLLQPTSPFRSMDSIKKATSLIKKKWCNSVISVSLSHAHPLWTFKMKGKYLKPFINKSGINTRSQDLENAFTVNGNFYLIKKEALIKYNSFISDKTCPVLLSNDLEAIDIDTHNDLKLANYYYKFEKELN